MPMLINLQIHKWTSRYMHEYIYTTYLKSTFIQETLLHLLNRRGLFGPQYYCELLNQAYEPLQGYSTDKSSLETEDMK